MRSSFWETGEEESASAAVASSSGGGHRSPPLWEADDGAEAYRTTTTSLFQNHTDDDLSRMLDRIASLDTSDAAGSAIAKPLWDTLLRSGSLRDGGVGVGADGSGGGHSRPGRRHQRDQAAGGPSSPGDNSRGGSVGRVRRRKVKQAEIRERHRVYKALLKAQIQALKLEEDEKEEVFQAMENIGGWGGSTVVGRGGTDDPEESEPCIDSSSPRRGPFPLRSSSANHQLRVDQIREMRLRRELRRAAKARLIRRKRREELVVDKLFKATLKEERRRLAVERAEARRAQKSMETERQKKLSAIEHQYAQRRKLMAEQLRQEKREQDMLDHARREESRAAARELREQKRGRFKELIEQLSRQDEQDAEKDWSSGLGAELEGACCFF